MAEKKKKSGVNLYSFCLELVLNLLLRQEDRTGLIVYIEKHTSAKENKEKCHLQESELQHLQYSLSVPAALIRQMLLPRSCHTASANAAQSIPLQDKMFHLELHGWESSKQL